MENILNASENKGSILDVDSKKPCNGQMGNKEKLAEALFKLFYASIVLSVVFAMIEKWSLM